MGNSGEIRKWRLEKSEKKKCLIFRLTKTFAQAKQLFKIDVFSLIFFLNSNEKFGLYSMGFYFGLVINAEYRKSKTYLWDGKESGRILWSLLIWKALESLFVTLAQVQRFCILCEMDEWGRRRERKPTNSDRPVWRKMWKMFNIHWTICVYILLDVMPYRTKVCEDSTRVLSIRSFSPAI